MDDQFADELDASSIRLVDIALEPPAADGSQQTPCLNVRRHALEELPAYYALSYTWGPPTMRRARYTEAEKITIAFNGKPFKVSPNLYDALLQLHRSYPGVPFWIDAVCIDQRKHTEREVQVGIMDQIYRRAAKVIIWLGKKGDQIDRGIEILKLYSQIAIREVVRIVQGHYQTFSVDITQPESLMRYGIPHLTKADAEALTSLYNFRWFHRIWILQEVALAQEAEVHWGDTSIPWDDLGKTAIFLQLSSISAGISFFLSGDSFDIKDIDAVGIGFLGAMRIQVVREWCKGGDNSPLRDALDFIEFIPGISGDGISILLLKLIFWTRVSFQASDPRDCVYGFQGILNHMFGGKNMLPAQLQPDYLAEPAEVLHRVASELFETVGSLHLLGWVCDPSYREISEKPSWVPDLSPTAAANPIMGPSMKSLVAGDSLFHASTTKAHPLKKFKIDGMKLRAHGQKVADVRMTGEDLDEAFQGELRGWAEIMRAMAPTYELTGQSRGDVFRRTIILDQDEAQRPASPEIPLKLQLATLWMIFSTAQKALDVDPSFDAHAFLLQQDVVFRAAEEVQDCPLPTRAMVEECYIKWGISPQTSETKELAIEDKPRWLQTFHADALSTTGLPLLEALGHRRPFLLENLYLGSGHKSTAKGDEVWILSGCPTPLVLRKVEGRGEYTLVGEAYVHGIMHGQFVDAESTPWVEICLV